MKFSKKKILSCAIFILLGECADMINQKIVAEYSASYCLGLEAAYGEGLMAEGGTAAIEKMFHGVDAKNKIAIDIGSGIGGVAMYLAKTYETKVTGVEINPWMVKESNRRIPPNLNQLLNFVLLQDDEKLPFADNSVDIVFSKGVLVHIENKIPMFREVFRVLKPGGLFLVDDWLGPVKGQWGGNIKKLIELEKLELFSETETGYREILTNTGFQNICMKNVSTDYSHYNTEIANRLDSLEANDKAALLEKFGPTFLVDAASGYRFIAQAQATRELLVFNIKGYKP